MAKAKRRQEPPSSEELAKLPGWAQVAFAARCARRVQPLFRMLCPEAPVERFEAIERTIRIAEGVATTSALSPRGVAATATAVGGTCAAACAAAACAAGAHAAAARAAANTIAAAEAKAAGAGAEAYSAHAEAYGAAAETYAADAAAYAAAAASAGAYAAATGWRDDVVLAMWRDLERLETAAKKERWTNETRVPVEFFGPLWPDGAPPNWPSATGEEGREAEGEQESYEQATVDLYIHPGNASTETIQEVLMALTDLHVAAGGLGLEFSNDGQFVYATERVER